MPTVPRKVLSRSSGHATSSDFHELGHLLIGGAISVVGLSAGGALPLAAGVAAVRAGVSLAVEVDAEV